MAVKEKTLRELNEEQKPPQDDFGVGLQVIGTLLGMAGLLGGIVYCIYLTLFG